MLTVLEVSWRSGRVIYWGPHGGVPQKIESGNQINSDKSVSTSSKSYDRQ